MLLFLVSGLIAGCSGGKRETEERSSNVGPAVEKPLRVASAAAGARLFRQCSSCHTIEKGGPDRAGPNLHGVMGKAIAGVSKSYAYSAALKAVEARWGVDSMDAWLASPKRFAPGTKMAYSGMPDPADRADVIAYLKEQSN